MNEWKAQEPPSDFAEKVLARALAEENMQNTRDEDGSSRARVFTWRKPFRTGIVIAASLAAAAAIAIVSMPHSPDAIGETIARDRVQVAIGSRASAVLEAGAHVTWAGDEVTQSAGDVFYRVDHGAPFRVHTPAGDVQVLGTCFRVRVAGSQEESAVNTRDLKSGIVGASLSALAFVAVYEGKVAVSHAGQSVTVAPGERAQTDETGVHRVGDDPSANGSIAPSTPTEGDEPYARANRNLVETVKEYKDRLTAIEAQKSALEAQLKQAQTRAATAEHDGRVPLDREMEFDPSDAELKELAKEGTVRARFPCPRQESWDYTPKQLDELGLSPDDGPAIHEAMAQSAKRVWSTLRPLCIDALGGSAATADKLGAATCQTLLFDVARSKGGDENDDLRVTAEIRAGLRPANEATTPLQKLLLVLSAQTKAVESDLAKSLGPDAAHRVAFTDVGCWNNSTWGGGPHR